MAAEPLARVSDATRAMLERLDAMEGEVADLLQSLRSRASRLAADLDGLQAGAAELGAPGRAVEPEAPEPAPVVEDFADEVEEEAEAAEAAAEVATEPEPAVADDSADAEGARLIALNLALSGTPRAQADRYLAENFDLDDRQRLLDDVYSRVG